jgi:hypothetical protein
VLFRLFAETSPDRASILAFASKYGNLTDCFNLRPVKQIKHKRSGPVPGVFLDTWQGQIAAVRRLAGWWDLIQHQDEEDLARHIVLQADSATGPSIHFESHPATATCKHPPLGDVPVREPIASRTGSPDVLERFLSGDVLAPAKTYLQVQLDQHLHHAADDVRVGMTWDSRRQQPVLSYWCRTLLSAVWLEFATVVNENLAFGRCPECKRWFEVGTNAARASREFCSTACRSKAYRQRQDRARQLFTAGTTFEEIAQQLDSDVATVRRWVTGFKE